ncbi:hypothetical protein L195_g059963, partial [Trifolium pratense]
LGVAIEVSSTSYCSTVTIVVFVALCLVGLWMMTSSVVPVQNVDESQETKNEVKEQSEQSQVKEQPTDTTSSDTTNSDTTDSNAQQFEDKQGDLPEDAKKEDSSVTSVTPDKQEEKLDQKPEFKSPEDTK